MQKMRSTYSEGFGAEQAEKQQVSLGLLRFNYVDATPSGEASMR